MPNQTIEGNYRYAYQGQEKDPETEMEAFELRLYDSKIGRWYRPDPKRQYHSPYVGIGNIPTSAWDKDGGYVYIMGKDGSLLRVYNKVMAVELGIDAVEHFINNPDSHVIISSASTKGAGGVTSSGGLYLAGIDKKTRYTSRTSNAILSGLSTDDQKKYKNHFKSFIGAYLQPGDNYLISIDLANNSPDFNLEAAFHEIYAHAYAKDALGIDGGTNQHIAFAGTENGHFDPYSNNPIPGPIAGGYPIESLYNSDIYFKEQGGITIGNVVPNFYQMGSLVFGNNVGGATQVQQTSGPVMTPDMYKNF